ncbi:MAG: ATP-dependent helicase [Euryarchaeota archaeon RBG_19FT_COMBO_56_21]|nr:MAG: ATP-dependent helicase [Euryarchaeota archaeon RBG_19FT_COMBO_56_21]
MKEFALLDERLQELLRKRGITEPTEPQSKAIPAILSGDHVLLVAPTGIGKTEAAMLPILHKLAQGRRGGIRCIYVTPLRALNRDLLKRLKEFGEAVDLRIAVRHGDTPQSERAAQTKNPPDVLITTPETLQILFTGRILRQHLVHVKHVVVDEIHELAEDERGAQLAVALERLVRTAGEYQRIGLSATVGSVDEVSNYLAGVGRNISVLRVSAVKDMRINVESPQADDSDKPLASRLQTDLKHIACMKRCRQIVEDHRSTLFFVNTRDNAEALGVRYHLWDESFRVGVHHGSLSKEIRVQMEDDFKSEKLKGLICTSSLELGIDVGSADFAIQFDSPRQVTRLIQRVGRSGHKVGEISVGSIITTTPAETAESIVIARRAMIEELEKFGIRDNPLSVLANQLVAMTLTEGRVDKQLAFETVKRAYPFRNLLRKDFDDVLRLLAELHILWDDESVFRKKTTGMMHFFDNISMIPDEKTYRIRDVSSRAIIGTLDESFVATYAEPYSTFVARGRTWRVVEVGEDEVMVEQIKELAATPSWVGEEIPVPFEVAMEVGAIRRLQAMDIYPADQDTKEELLKWIRSQGERPLPTDKLVTVEQGDGVIVLNCCFGSRVNETISKLVAGLLTAKSGESVGVQSDVYSIVLETPRNIRAGDVVKILRETDASSLGPLLRLLIRNSSYLRWQFVHVAKKFGAIRKGADYKMLNLSKLVDVFEHSPIYEEAIAKTMWENMDVDATEAVLRRIQDGSIGLETGPLSHIGKEAIGTRKELMQPQRADKAVLNVLRDRLSKEDIVMVCLNCRTQKRSSVGLLPDKIRCAKCEGVLMAAIQPYIKTQLDLLKKGPTNEEQRKELKRIYKNANLVMAHGKKAVLALVGRGVGPDTAARILARYQTEEDEFLRDILAAEIMYARTKRFWD